MEPKIFSTSVAGKTLTAEFNTLAERAHGSCLVRFGHSAVLATAVIGSEKPGTDFVPLTVDYEEKFYAAGAILGSRFLRREGRPSDHAILSARAIDRTLRPLFPKSLRREVQVIITVLAVGEDDPDMLSVIAASLALGTSPIPWNGPISAVRVSGENFNPTYKEREGAAFDLFVCGTGEMVTMVEMSGKEIGEERIASALERALPELAKLQEFQERIMREMGKGKIVIAEKSFSPALAELFETLKAELETALFEEEREETDALAEKWVALALEKLPEVRESEARAYFATKSREIFREGILAGRRRGGRKADEVRPLEAIVGGISPVLHGSGTFYRGGTHVLSVLTLGGPEDALLVDSIETKMKKRFMHHYNFPPFSTGDTGRVGSTNRRMTGHGALAEKALEPVIPPRTDFPYTIRLVSECLSSDGSTSMASVSASSLALMDGGVPIKRPVAGIAIGLVSEGERYVLLTDIEGKEDHYGDMDFKVAGTSEGVTALQLDVKTPGIPVSVVKEALARAKTARGAVLAALSEAISAPRERVSSHAPHIITLPIPKEKIGSVIGSQGKTIREIEERTGAEVTIEESTAFIIGRNGAAEEAARIVGEIIHDYVPGETFEGIVTKTTSFGAFVHLGEGAEGLLHISEMGAHTEALPQEGARIRVRVKNVDDRGRISLSLS